MVKIPFIPFSHLGRFVPETGVPSEKCPLTSCSGDKFGFFITFCGDCHREKTYRSSDISIHFQTYKKGTCLMWFFYIWLKSILLTFFLYCIPNRKEIYHYTGNKIIKMIKMKFAATINIDYAGKRQDVPVLGFSGTPSLFIMV